MNGNLRWSLSRILLILINSLGYAQLPEYVESQAAEHFMINESSTLSTEILEDLNDLLLHPINLNRATEEELSKSRLFTPFQVHVLLKYRDKYGDLYSIYELPALPGFRVNLLKEISPYICTVTGGAQIPEKSRRHLILINTSRTFPLSSGYQVSEENNSSTPYASGPLRFSLRAKGHLNQKIQYGMACEKDPGEAFFKHYQPEYISGYLSLVGSRIIQQLVLGSFRISHGLGLVNGMGFSHSPEQFQLNRLSISKLNPYASLNEVNFHNGIAFNLKLHAWNLKLWSSCKKMDLSTGTLPGNSKHIDWISYRRETGLHRTINEINGRSMGYQYSSGLQVSRRFGRLSLGSMFGLDGHGLTRRGMDSLKLGDNHCKGQSISIHWLWYSDAAEAFGEFAVRSFNAHALLTGLRYHFNDFLDGMLLLHHYSPAFQGIFPSSYATTTRFSNDTGLAFHLHAEPGRYFTVSLVSEWMRYPEPRYQSDVPSAGFRNRCILKNTGNSKLEWSLQFERRIWQRTLMTDPTGPKNLQSLSRSRMKFKIRYNPVANLQWDSRLVYSKLAAAGHHDPGYVTFHQLNLKHLKRVSFKIRFLVFYVKDWDNRIYLYEPGLYYSFRFPSYFGQGQKISTVISFKPNQSLTLGGRVTWTSYLNKDGIGTGNDLIEGKNKWEAEVQLRIRY